MKRILTLSALFILPAIASTQIVGACLPEGIVFTTQAQIDSFQINYPGCTEIEGSVHINGDDITCLHSLSVLNSIGGDLYIIDNDALNNLAGLENISSVGGSLSIWNNDQLICIAGLQNIESSTITNLSIGLNTSLSACDVQSICEYLSSPNGVVRIFENSVGCNNPPEIAANCGFPMPCLPFGDYIFFHQTEIDNFQSNYPGCINLFGDVQISGFFGGRVYNLQGLNDLISVTGDLEIELSRIPNLAGLENLVSVEDLRIYGNAYMTSLTGLESLTSIEGGLNIQENNILSSLEGLESLTSIGRAFILKGNNALISLTGLENVTSFDLFSLIIEDNNALPNLSGLDSVTAIAFLLKISDNDVLTDLAALENVTIGGDLYIYNNHALNSLEGLNNIEAQTIENLHIYHNNSLSTCEVESVCSYLADPNGEIDIHNNAPGCNSVEEVQEACEFVTIEEYTYTDEQLLYPNPSQGLVNITYSLIEDSRVTIDIFNLSGIRVLRVIETEERKGEHQRLVDLGSLPPGMYLVVMQTGNGKVVEKIVKH